MLQWEYTYLRCSSAGIYIKNLEVSYLMNSSSVGPYSTPYYLTFFLISIIVSYYFHQILGIDLWIVILISCGITPALIRVIYFIIPRAILRINYGKLEVSEEITEATVAEIFYTGLINKRLVFYLIVDDDWGTFVDSADYSLPLLQKGDRVSINCKILSRGESYKKREISPSAPITISQKRTC